MEFNFLPKLPNSNLDDRTFKDLVEECLLRIPRYCPEWTNYNASDPGITLLEMFAWLTDQMFARLNQVPRRNYVLFLELLGVRLRGPVPAQTELTFYLTSVLPEIYTIPTGTEVGTIRTDIDESVIFSTARPLSVCSPTLRHILTADSAEDQPNALRDRTGLWNERANGQWESREQPLFNENPQVGNCFYLVFNSNEPTAGNVISVTVRGAAATTIGINPEMPPRTWEAWNGEFWQPVLLQESDDGTQGFSFYEATQRGRNPLQGSDIVLHLPQAWPVTQFISYQGRWIRCRYTEPKANQAGYSSSPRVVGLSMVSLGGTVTAIQCSSVRDELLGESDGTPGQTFQIHSAPVLDRIEGEHILVIPPGELPQIWQEVQDFADSRADDRHYTVDSVTGQVQFGPLLREPGQLKQRTQLRLRVEEAAGRYSTPDEREVLEGQEVQYGAVPPRGSEIRMVAYRTGGGYRGNVQAGTIRVMKTAVPYVARVTNYQAAYAGADAESLEQAAMRAPKLLRTRDRAVTREDFEHLAVQAGRGAVARAICPPNSQLKPGLVPLLIVPYANLDGIERGEGVHPDQFILSAHLQERILAYLDDRKLLGVQVRLQAPEYVGVSVQTEVALEPAYNNVRARHEIQAQLKANLYRFFNPLTGGADGQGWPFGRPVYPSDVVTLLQQTQGVRYLGVVQLFELRKQGQEWIRSLPSDPIVHPGSLGLICSWLDPQVRSGHVINFIG